MLKLGSVGPTKTTLQVEAWRAERSLTIKERVFFSPLSRLLPPLPDTRTGGRVGRGYAQKVGRLRAQVI